MKEEIKLKIEKIFRESTSPDELFDYFQQALKNKLKDADLYKILLGNMVLSPDEIKMFTEKLCGEFKDLCFDLYMWAANILEAAHTSDCSEAAYDYYMKAIETNKTDHRPYISLINMYNSELDIPPKDSLSELFSNGLKTVAAKSDLCKGIASFYEKLDDMRMKRKFLALAAKYYRASQ